PRFGEGGAPPTEDAAHGLSGVGADEARGVCVRDEETAHRVEAVAPGVLARRLPAAPRPPIREPAPGHVVLEDPKEDPSRARRSRHLSKADLKIEIEVEVEGRERPAPGPAPHPRFLPSPRRAWSIH